METNPTLEFELFLAQKLGRMLGELRAMPNGEFVLWSMYYARKAQREELETLKAKGGGGGG